MLRWDPASLGLGAACALPAVAFSLFLFLGPWRPQGGDLLSSELRAAVLEPDGGQGEEPPPPFPASLFPEHVRGACNDLRRQYTLSNPGLAMGPVGELAVILVGDLAGESLRAVGLSFGRGWLQDRLLEGGADPQLAQDWAPWLVFAGVLGVGLGLDFAARPRGLGDGEGTGAASDAAVLEGAQVMKVERNKITGKLVPVPMTMSELSEEARAQLEGRVKRRRVAFLLEKARGKLETMACTGAFFLSGGNLLAPYAASVFDQAVFSCLQRVTQKGIEGEMERELQKLQRESLAAQSRAKEEEGEAAAGVGAGPAEGEGVGAGAGAGAGEGEGPGPGPDP